MSSCPIYRNPSLSAIAGIRNERVNVVSPGLLLPASSASSALHCSLEYPLDMPEPGELAALDDCQQLFLLTCVGGDLLSDILVYTVKEKNTVNPIFVNFH